MKTVTIKTEWHTWTANQVAAGHYEIDGLYFGSVRIRKFDEYRDLGDHWYLELFHTTDRGRTVGSFTWHSTRRDCFEVLSRISNNLDAGRGIFFDHAVTKDGEIGHKLRNEVMFQLDRERWDDKEQADPMAEWKPVKVFVYFNLHKKMFSVKALEGPNKGRVIAHEHNVKLDRAVFKVSEAGRQRVIAEQRKNVHAGVVGYWTKKRPTATYDFIPADGVAITYNPYKYDSFVTVGGERPVERADRVEMSTTRGVMASCVRYKPEPTDPTPRGTVTREVSKSKKPAAVKSSVIYRGPSLIDGSPIVAVAVVKSGNGKTGDMVQTYIQRSDVAPVEASRTGADYSICGNCPHRGQAHDGTNGKKQALNRSCYVVLGQGPTIVHKALERGVYPDALDDDARAAIGAGRMVRLGTYGDPAAVPSEVWDALLRDAKGHTAYTHQSGVEGADHRPDLFMTSADTLDDALEAWGRGERTFRIIASTSDRVEGREVLCPASEEAGRRTTCDKCGLCAGASVQARNVAIVAHGAGAGNLSLNVA